LAEEILDYFKSKELQNLRLVCHLWDHVITQLFEVYYNLSHLNWTQLINTPIRFLHVKINNPKPLEMPLDQELFRSFCNRLQKLDFSWIDFDLTYLRILESAQSLRELKLSQIEFPEWPSNSELTALVNSDAVTSWLPMLQKLTFDRTTSIELRTILARIVQNGRLLKLGTDLWSRGGILQKLIEKYQYLREGVTTQAAVDDPSLELVANIIRSNYRTLRTISSTRTEEHITFHCREVSLSPGIQNINLEIGIGSTDDSEFQHFVNILHLLKKQENMNALSLQISASFDTPVTKEEQMYKLIWEIITQNISNLTRLELRLSGHSNLELAWATGNNQLFSICVSLKYLVLEFFPDLRKQILPGNSIETPQFTGLY